MNIDKDIQKKQEKAYGEITKIAQDAGLDLIIIRNEDILTILEGEDDLIAKLNPENCDQIRQAVVEFISDDYGRYISDAVDIVLNDGEETSEEQTSEEDKTDA